MLQYQTADKSITLYEWSDLNNVKNENVYLQYTLAKTKDSMHLEYMGIRLKSL